MINPVSSNRVCAQCGSPLPDGALERLCPRCEPTLQGRTTPVPLPVAETIIAPGKMPASHSSRPTVAPVTGESTGRVFVEATTAATTGSGSLSATDAGSAMRFFGDYEILGEIARGGMGIVYRARQVSLDRLVALKMLRNANLADESDRRRFKTEAEAAGGLDHPNIVPVYEVGEYEGQQYFSMQLIEGRSLTPEMPRLLNDTQAAVRIISAVARAVHHAHQRGILHRDIKPANILVDKDGCPHVTDFGLAKRVDTDETSSLTRTGAIVGTPAYMAPEQAAGNKEITTGADVYGLGAVFYEMLTACPPFAGRTPLDLLMKVKNDDVLPPRKRNPRVDLDLNTICLKCLEKEPRKRYGSAEALAEDLERWQRGEPILARPITGTERVAKWIRRKPMAAAAAGLLVVVAAGFVLRFFEVEKNAIEQTRLARIAQNALKEQRRLSFEAIVRNADADSGIGESAKVIAALEPYFLDRELAQHPMFAKAERLINEAREGYRRFAVFAEQVGRGAPSVGLDLGRGVTMELVLIPPGAFVMGSPASDKERHDNELAHEVKITQAFYMGRFHVTQEQYETVTGTNPSFFKGRPKNPVETVSWPEAAGFCEKLMKQSGAANVRFALPTEAEWEYACRGGTQTQYYFGDDVNELEQHAWYKKNAGLGTAGYGTHPVGEKNRPNKYGLHDMHGNVFHWCQDWYDSKYYSKSPNEDPRGPEHGEFQKSSNSPLRVLRGGSWLHNAKNCRSASRGGDDPGSRVFDDGFRVVVRP